MRTICTQIWKKYIFKQALYCYALEKKGLLRLVALSHGHEYLSALIPILQLICRMWEEHRISLPEMARFTLGTSARHVNVIEPTFWPRHEYY